MQQSTFLRLPKDIRVKIFQHTLNRHAEIRLPIAKDPIKRKKWEEQYRSYTPRRFRKATRQQAAVDDLDWWIEPPWLDDLVFSCKEQPTVFLAPDGHCFSDTTLAQVNRQLRREVDDHLKVHAVEVIAQVSNLDFDTVIKYLRELPAAQQTGFAVSERGIYEKLLRIELCGPYDTQCGRNLERWLEYIVEIVGADEEYATAVKMNWPAQKDRKIESLQLPISRLEFAYESRREGSAKLEIHRLLSAYHSTKNRYEYFHFSGGWMV